ncbi:DUF1622 domain-containing protein [Deinococcus maricopensis]|uniref:DUF1622 domain-containing protein n=1 Tax=Deinococcus maricopensis (strain DSM 21211 / LMG 22137 / NRRL B-23946 / LB-34) TaxID=709986 RepID=E8U825_DEIML|nr:DUF1622 domain-containing protein [Deinococcus maricopensis]ADV67214.1 protein of unknown function DUF1622 [Deinococcus maricopensis DSM 21211]
MDHVIRDGTFVLSSLVEGAAAIIIAIAVIQACVRTALAFVGRDRPEHLRLMLGRWLAVALELLLAADILRTAVAPSWDDIGKLAAIAALRTLLNYFLEREIHVQQPDRADPGDAPTPHGPARP